MLEPWIETYSGKYFDFLDPKPNQIDIEDVAHGLSNMCRYTGQCLHYYSVAEHSVLTSTLVPKELALVALLHDASEAYLADIASPVKQYLSQYKIIENKIMLAIANKFDFDWPLPEQVRQADFTMLSTEAYHLIPSRGVTWQWPEDRPYAHNISIQCLEPKKAKHLFLERFKELYESK